MDLLNLFKFFAIGSNNFLQDRDLYINWKIVDIIQSIEINFWHFLKNRFRVSFDRVKSKSKKDESGRSFQK